MGGLTVSVNNNSINPLSDDTNPRESSSKLAELAKLNIYTYKYIKVKLILQILNLYYNYMKILVCLEILAYIEYTYIQLLVFTYIC
jgi:hypothetical protein